MSDPDLNGIHPSKWIQIRIIIYADLKHCFELIV